MVRLASPNIPPPDLLHLVGASCPKMDKLGNDPCEVRYGHVGQPKSGHPTPGFRPKGDVFEGGAACLTLPLNRLFHLLSMIDYADLRTQN